MDFHITWKCPVCGFQAHSAPEQRNHSEDSQNNPDHKVSQKKLSRTEKNLDLYHLAL